MIDHRRNIISHKYRFLFWGIPKCATTTMIKYFITEKEMDYQANKLIFSSTKFKKNYFNWTIVRNPFSRLVSAYKNKVKNTKPEVIKYHKKFGIFIDITFDEFVNKIKDGVWESHWYPMFNYVPRKIHYVCKLEKLYEDIDYVREILEIPKLKIPHAGKTDNDWQKYYNENTKRLIIKLYEKDFKLFNYDKDFSCYQTKD